MTLIRHIGVFFKKPSLRLLVCNFFSNNNRLYGNYFQKCTNIGGVCNLHQNLKQKRFIHDEEEEEDVGDIDDVNKGGVFEEDPHFTKNILYPNTSDPLMNEINQSASIQEVFNIIMNNKRNIKCDHIVQCTLNLVDLKKLYQQINLIHTDKSDAFIKNLTANEGFQLLLSLIEAKIDDFDTNLASYVFLCLHKLGLDLNNELLQALLSKLKIELQNNFCPASASRLISGVFTEHSGLKSYFLVQDLIPKIISYIEQCKTAHDLKHLTECLQRVDVFIDDTVLGVYKNKIKSLEIAGIIEPSDYKTILTVLLFLNRPIWRDENRRDVIDYMHQLRESLHLFNAYEIIQIFQAFVAIQEPASILNDIQRYSSKWLLHYEDDDFGLSDETKLKLLLVVIYFGNSLEQRKHCEKQLKKYLKKDLNAGSLYSIRKILSYIKSSDLSLSNTLWNKMLSHLTAGEDENRLIKMCLHYVMFSNKSINFRHEQFENAASSILRKNLATGTILCFPWKYSLAAMFVLPYCRDKYVVDTLVNQIEDNWYQLSPLNCWQISKGINLSLNFTQNRLFTQQHCSRINDVLDRCAFKDNTSKIYSLHWRSLISRKSSNDDVLKMFLKNYDKNQEVSSVMLRNILFCLTKSNVLLPEFLDRLVNYVVEQKNNVTSFNMEYVLYLCYYFGYNPNNDQFFDVVIDTMIRDQERLSGLAYVKAALSLSFFHKLPPSMIKSIFNVEFLNKLDSELANCYSKEKYPIRVRNTMMLLNRSVCLDYPEAQVPWFHEKFVQEQQYLKLHHKKKERIYAQIEEYLAKIFNTDVECDVYTPYGYIIDFAITLNDYEKIAFLLMYPHSYSRINELLKGEEQMKIRHLEILGYKVISIKFSEIIKLMTGNEKSDYLLSLMRLEKNDEKNIKHTQISTKR